MRDILNKRFGKLTVKEVISYYEDSRGIKKRIIKCDCDCGNTTTLKEAILNFKDKASCGCASGGQNSTHGMSNERVYKIWVDIKVRCYNENSAHFENYGGRGIKMCDRWKDSFENFYNDMGDRPSNKHSIERLDVNKDYSPENCIWTTHDKQCRNRRMRSDNKTGVNGVSLKKTLMRNKKDYHYSYTTWWYENGKKRSKTFALNKYGKEEAFRLACEARENAIKELNEQGAGYSENHGK